MFGQQSDTTKIIPDSVKTVLPDSTVTDSTKTKKSDITSVITAAATDSLIYDVRNKKMFIYGSGDLKYKDTGLKSAKIFIDYDTNELEAYGIADTADSAKGKLKNTPVLTEGGEAYEGTWLRYNFKNQSGYISMAKNKEDDSRYEGEKVKKLDKETYFIDNGMFTTCEEDTPHTYFTADQMKVIQGDKIIARWIFMNIGGVPFPIPLPFGVFPNKSGRRSGIIVPTYGQDISRGQYFHNFGYFWAMNDYMDLSLSGDYYTKGGYGLRSRFRYAERYDFNAIIEAGYSRIKVGEENDPLAYKQDGTDWLLSVLHSQTIDPTMSLNAKLSFQSSNFLNRNSIDYNNLLRRSITSSATFNKKWGDDKSLNFSYSRTQDLDSGTIDELLPRIYFSKQTAYPFAEEENTSTSSKKWYEYIGYSYSGTFQNNRKKESGTLKIRGGIQHDIDVSASPKVGYFNISPSFSYTEKWYNKRIEQENFIIEKLDSTTGEIKKVDSLVTREIKEINFVRTFQMSLSASTKLYGIIQPNILGIEAFRHTITPRISYQYFPDFSADQWGYWGSYVDAQGKVVKYDRYGDQIFGGSGSGENQNINFSVGNVFEIKTAKDPSDTTKSNDSNKIQLLNFDANVGYNFAADSLKLSDLNLSYRTQIGSLLSFNGSSTYTFYDFVNKKIIDRTLASAGKGLFRLKNFYFSISANLTGEKQETKSKPSQRAEDKEEELFKKSTYTNSIYEETETPDFSIPWNLSLNYNYNLSKRNPDEVTKNSNVSANLSFSLTEYWKFTVRGSYDFERKEISAPQITIYRDLHCWEMNFTWNPLGTYRGFRFEIRMKAPEFKDLKVTKSSGLYSGRL